MVRSLADAVALGLALGIALLPKAAVAQPAPATAPPAASSEQLAGRGVYYFPGQVRCPLAGVGSRGPQHSNRLALDDEHSQVSIDRTAHRIVFTNRHSYSEKRLVGDLLFLGVGTTAAGLQAPVGIHLKLEKRGDSFAVDVHAHPTVRDSITSAQFEPFEVVVRSGSGDTTVLTPSAALQSIREPSFGLRLASKLLDAIDNLDGPAEDPSRPGYRLVDISFGFGIGGLGKKLIRGQVVSVEGSNAALIQHGSLPDMLRSGVWELRLRALSNLDGDAFERDLFLIGLDGLPMLKPLAKDGMERDNMLTIRLRSGRGTVFFGNQGQPLASAADVARAYLEFNAIGAILGHQITVRRR